METVKNWKKPVRKRVAVDLSSSEMDEEGGALQEKEKGTFSISRFTSGIL